MNNLSNINTLIYNNEIIFKNINMVNKKKEEILLRDLKY